MKTNNGTINVSCPPPPQTSGHIVQGRFDQGKNIHVTGNPCQNVQDHIIRDRSSHLPSLWNQRFVLNVSLKMLWTLTVLHWILWSGFAVFPITLVTMTTLTSIPHVITKWFFPFITAIKLFTYFIYHTSFSIGFRWNIMDGSSCVPVVVPADQAYIQWSIGAN